MKAVVVQQDKKVKVEDVPVPTPKDEEILLRVLAVGQNPTGQETDSSSHLSDTDRSQSDMT